VWGRDEAGPGEMWNSNSTISWLIVRSGLHASAVQPPAGGRAPGWHAMTDAEAVENARENERELGEEFARSPLPEDPTPEQAWKYVNELWEGDPGGRGWQVRVPAGATWLALRDDEDDPARAGGPEPTFGFGEPPAAEGNWEAPGY
jgi:hypothetical protein